MASQRQPLPVTSARSAGVAGVFRWLESGVYLEGKTSIWRHPCRKPAVYNRFGRCLRRKRRDHGKRNERQAGLSNAPGNQAKIQQWYEADNCRSMNEFIEKAVNFYADYLVMSDSNMLLPTAISSAMDGRLGLLEKNLRPHLQPCGGTGYADRDLSQPPSSSTRMI